MPPSIAGSAAQMISTCFPAAMRPSSRMSISRLVLVGPVPYAPLQACLRTSTTAAFTPALHSPVLVRRQPGRSCMSAWRGMTTIAAAAGLGGKGSSLKPRIVLVGWLGAQQRHFDKYIQLWEDLGHETISIRPSTSAILLPVWGDYKAHFFAERLQEAVTANPQQPVVYHVFSNAGFLFLCTVLRLATLGDHQFKQTPVPAQTTAAAHATAHSPVENELVAGQRQADAAAVTAFMGRMDAVIFDSAPAPITPDMAARGFTAAVLGQPAEGVEERHPRLVAATRGPLSWLLNHQYIAFRSSQLWATWGLDLASSRAGELTDGFPATLLPIPPSGSAAGAAANGGHERWQLLQRLAAAAPTCPQLALYSSADVLIPPASVQAFTAAQRARGVSTTLKEWHDTAHCEHYRVHKEEYREELVAFLKSLTV